MPFDQLYLFPILTFPARYAQPYAIYSAVTNEQLDEDDFVSKTVIITFVYLLRYCN